MSVLINMEMPKEGTVYVIDAAGQVWSNEWPTRGYTRLDGITAVPVPPHGRLIDADALRAKMYHEAFETDTPMQKWDSGCWIRYKLFEMTEESAPTIIPAEGKLT